MRTADQAGLFLETLRAVSRKSRNRLANLYLRLPQMPVQPHNNAGELLLSYPAALRPGDPEIGQQWMAGDHSLDGAVVKTLPSAPQSSRGETIFALNANVKWQASLYSFDWGRHILALNTIEARRYVIAAMMEFAERKHDKRPAARAPQTIARRLLRWSALIGAMGDHISIVERSALMLQVHRDFRLLTYMLDQAEDGTAHFEASAALTFTALWLNNLTDVLRTGMDNLSRAIKRQILPDGGPASRCPETLLDQLADLLAIQTALKARKIDAPSVLSDTIPLMQNMLAFLTMSDGRLADFHGGTPLSRDMVAALAPSKAAYKKFSFAAKTGFQKLQFEKSTLLVDIAGPPRGAISTSAHFAPLAMEFSHGEDRIFVNCGPNRVHGADWRLATRGIAGHSTPAFQRDMLDPFLTQGIAGRVLGPRILENNFPVTVKRTDGDDGSWLEARHGAFGESHGADIQRRFYLSGDGHDMRGEESFLVAREHEPAFGSPFCIRFHLHPHVSANLQAGGMSCLLVTGSGRGWQFRAAGSGNRELYNMHLEPSVYMGMGGIPQRSQQIVLTGRFQPEESMFRWAVKFVGQLRRRKR